MSIGRDARAAPPAPDIARGRSRGACRPGRPPDLGWAQDPALAPEPGAPAPAASTITAILARHDLLTGPRAGEPRAYQRFEHPVPNALWQMDFMGHKAIGCGRVHPLTVLDDHSRFALGLFACAHEQAVLVQTHLIHVFRAYGLPQAILTDHGPAWGSSAPGILTWLEAWLIRLGIGVWHGRFRHPQTQGKIERWHGTIATDVFQFGTFPDFVTTQVAFDAYRTDYNTERPHEAIDLEVPISRYRVSDRPYPETLPEIVSSDDHTVATVTGGWVWFAKRRIEVGEAFRGCRSGSARPPRRGSLSSASVTRTSSGLTSAHRPEACLPCPRTPVEDVSGLHTCVVGRGCMMGIRSPRRFDCTPGRPHRVGPTEWREGDLAGGISVASVGGQDARSSGRDPSRLFRRLHHLVRAIPGVVCRVLRAGGCRIDTDQRRDVLAPGTPGIEVGTGGGAQVGVGHEVLPKPGQDRGGPDHGFGPDRHPAAGGHGPRMEPDAQRERGIENATVGVFQLTSPTSVDPPPPGPG